MRAVFGYAVLAAAVVTLPISAVASHGKVGLWDITVSMKMANAPQIPPDQLAKLKAMGITIPNGNTMTVQHCMTQAEVAVDAPPQMQRNKNCSMQNVKITGGAYSADMVCSGPDMNGSGHLQASYDSDSHYAGRMTFSGTSHGHSANMTNNFEGRWVSASCGNVGH